MRLPWHGARPIPVKCEDCSWTSTWIKAPGREYKPCPCCRGKVVAAQPREGAKP